MSPKKKKSLVAPILPGFCSCLVTAVMTDLWVHTVEPIATPKPPPHLRSLYEAAASVSLSSDSTPVDYRNPMAIDFDIGLWKVCPSVKEWIHSEYASKLVGSLRVTALVPPFFFIRFHPSAVVNKDGASLARVVMKLRFPRCQFLEPTPIGDATPFTKGSEERLSYGFPGRPKARYGASKLYA